MSKLNDEDYDLIGQLFTEHDRLREMRDRLQEEFADTRIRLGDLRRERDAIKAEISRLTKRSADKKRELDEVRQSLRMLGPKAIAEKFECSINDLYNGIEHRVG